MLAGKCLVRPLSPVITLILKASKERLPMDSEPVDARVLWVALVTEHFEGDYIERACVGATGLSYAIRGSGGAVWVLKTK